MNVDGLEIFVEWLPGKRHDLNFVLVHNAGGNHQFLSYQLEFLKRYGNVIWLDLPGHGKSESLNSYEMADLAMLIKQICEKLSLNNLCLIGLNNGAGIIIETVANHSLPMHSIILIDPPIFMENTFIKEINHFIEKLSYPGYDEFVKTLVDSLFIETSTLSKEITLKAFNSVDKKTLQSIFKGLIEWDKSSSGKLKQITYPILCLLTDEYHCSYEKMVCERAPHFEIGKLVGSKCWAIT
jgi:pimeloyl-ACP methyl ester carboxylesterase